jgi:hypothetical protein
MDMAAHQTTALVALRHSVLVTGAADSKTVFTTILPKMSTVSAVAPLVPVLSWSLTDQTTMSSNLRTHLMAWVHTIHLLDLVAHQAPWVVQWADLEVSPILMVDSLVPEALALPAMECLLATSHQIPTVLPWEISLALMVACHLLQASTRVLRPPSPAPLRAATLDQVLASQVDLQVASPMADQLDSKTRMTHSPSLPLDWVLLA